VPNISEYSLTGKNGKAVEITWTYDGHDENIEEYKELLKDEIDPKIRLMKG
tara:strand:+ start:365 stop:517 length:153 start_codon:yes stop_codon:yes gene_type:complete